MQDRHRSSAIFKLGFMKEHLNKPIFRSLYTHMVETYLLHNHPYSNRKSARIVLKFFVPSGFLYFDSFRVLQKSCSCVLVLLVLFKLSGVYFYVIRKRDTHKLLPLNNSIVS